MQYVICQEMLMMLFSNYMALLFYTIFFFKHNAQSCLELLPTFVVFRKKWTHDHEKILQTNCKQYFLNLLHYRKFHDAKKPFFWRRFFLNIKNNSPTNIFFHSLVIKFFKSFNFATRPWYTRIFRWPVIQKSHAEFTCWSVVTMDHGKKA